MVTPLGECHQSHINFDLHFCDIQRAQCAEELVSALPTPH